MAGRCRACGLRTPVRQLAGIAGRFILTINAIDSAREVFGRFYVDDVDTTYSIGAEAASAGKPVKEFNLRG